MTETTHPIRISVQIKPQHATYAQFRDAAKRAEALGVDTIYTWEYGVQRQDLRNLYEKSKGAMWNASTYLA